MLYDDLIGNTSNMYTVEEILGCVVEYLDRIIEVEKTEPVENQEVIKFLQSEFSFYKATDDFYYTFVNWFRSAFAAAYRDKVLISFDNFSEVYVQLICDKLVKILSNLPCARNKGLECTWEFVYSKISCCKELRFWVMHNGKKDYIQDYFNELYDDFEV